MDIELQEKESLLHLNCNPQKSQIIEQVRKWGSFTSDAILDPLCKHFTTPGVEGLIGYRIESGCAIVFGDPICSDSNIPALVRAFHQFCLKQQYRIMYITTSEPFAKWFFENVGGVSIEFGEELYDDLKIDPRAREGVNGSLVRRKVKHAVHEGTTVDEYKGDDQELENAIEQVGAAWLQTRRGLQVHISHVYLFDNRQGKRWFYAKQKDRIVGVVLLNQLQVRQGWLLNHLMHLPDAPHGTPELLVVTALETVRNEGYHYVTFGPVTTGIVGEIIGLGRFTEWFTRRVFNVANSYFRLSGRKKFWEKFHPESSRSFILFNSSRISLKDINGLAKALNIRD